MEGDFNMPTLAQIILFLSLGSIQFAAVVGMSNASRIWPQLYPYTILLYVLTFVGYLLYWARYQFVGDVPKAPVVAWLFAFLLLGGVSWVR